MSENLRAFTEAVYAFDAVVNRMPAEGWDAPSACEGWSGRDVVEHQCAVLNGVAAMAQTGAMTMPTPPADVSDPVATWRATRDELLAALDRQGALEQQGPFWFDTPDIDGLIGFVAWDPLTHAWDLARCADLDPALNPALTEWVMARIEPMQPMLNKSGRTGERVSAADDAGVVERYLALVGRNP
ncbi:MAG: maleylpyruvate isomerase family mycothiol-dependent enzyme [Actinomycetota bacterium]